MWNLYSLSEDPQIQKGDFKFMLNKLSESIG